MLITFPLRRLLRPENVPLHGLHQDKMHMAMRSKGGNDNKEMNEIETLKRYG
jgi:hypothetical protein